ncbi:MAG: hypothetical protein JNG82_04435 [Opitutaceae bacterium]|nr:hypothetical protein [Opitutaceae bacterium]
MNTSHKFLLLVTATVGLAGFGLANNELVARLPVEALLAVVVSLGLLRVAFSDYTRRAKPLPLPAATILRPVPRAMVRASALVERCAA